MLDRIREGLIGLTLVMSHWLAPGERAAVEVESVARLENGYRIECELQIAWNQQLARIVDAGVPLRFRIGCFARSGDTTSFLRTLHFNIDGCTYYFTDTSLVGGQASPRRSRNYPQVLLALRDLTQWSFTVPPEARSCLLEVELLPSPVSRLNRSVDMSRLWGQRSVSRTVVLGEP